MCAVFVLSRVRDLCVVRVCVGGKLANSCSDSVWYQWSRNLLCVIHPPWVGPPSLLFFLWCCCCCWFRPPLPTTNGIRDVSCTADAIAKRDGLCFPTTISSGGRKTFRQNSTTRSATRGRHQHHNNIPPTPPLDPPLSSTGPKRSSRAGQGPLEDDGDASVSSAKELRRVCGMYREFLDASIGLGRSLWTQYDTSLMWWGLAVLLVAAAALAFRAVSSSMPSSRASSGDSGG